MTARALSFVFALLAVPALAGTPLEPPARYAGPYDGKVTIIQVKKDNVAAECEAIYGQHVRPDAAGCQFFDDAGDCVIYLAMYTTRGPLEAIVEHELAHCKGWPGDHPD